MDPWDHFKMVDQFAVDVGDYDFGIYTQPKQRAHNGRSKHATREWEAVVNEAAEEQAPRILPAGRLSMQALFLSQRPPGDLSNAIKSLEDALNGRAYKDDRQIDHLNCLRVYGPDIPNRILVRVRERQ